MIGVGVSKPIAVDVLVIGGGAAGAFAALAARERGATVAVVRRAWAATALSSGAADVAPDPLSNARTPLGGRMSVIESARHLASRRPDHPYAALQGRLALLPAALDFASRQTGGRLSFAGAERENHAFLSPMGLPKLSAGGLDSIVAGDLLGVSGTIGAVGFDLHPIVDARLLAAAANEAARRAGLPLRAVPIECDFLRRSGDSLLRPHEIAARIDDDPERLVESLRRALPIDRPQRLLLPPVLSRRDPRPVLEALEAGLGIPCAELLAAGESVPGVRLQQALEARLDEAGIELIHGEVYAASGAEGDATEPRPHTVGDSMIGIRMRGAAPPNGVVASDWPIEAGAVVLATGKFIGGGIRREGRLREPIFDLPVWIGDQVDEGSWLGDRTAYELRDPQPALRAGLRIDEELHPLLRDHRLLSPRLFACGDVLAGNDPAEDGAGIGLAIFTGYLAGLEAAAAAGLSLAGFVTAGESPSGERTPDSDEAEGR